jgi:hypothetical protein
LELTTRYNEICQNTESTSFVDDLSMLLQLSKKEKDFSLSMKIFETLIEKLREKSEYEKAIKLLEEEINEEFFTRKEEVLKIIDEFVKTLLRTEDFIKLKSVLFTRERFISNEHQKVMQKFYLAVVNEGLQEYKVAIDNLNSIKDNISVNNLVSKYLKLSMLYLKEKDIQNAKDNFFKACRYDPKKLNPIFYLAESDILYFEGDYLNSLNLYQEYFIKSKNKRRYLDRYILINIKLNRLDEAWRFYQEFLPTMKNLISKNYRIVFYQAAINLSEILKNNYEIEKLNILVQELQDDKPVLNQFDNVYRLLSITFRKKSYYKERDIIHDIYKAIDSLYKFQKLVFINKTSDSIALYHYSKGLLLEKKLKITDYQDTLIEKVLSTKSINDLYTIDDLNQYSKSLYKTDKTNYVFVNGIERDEVYNYFVVYSEDIDNFIFQQRLVLIANEIIKKMLNDFDTNSNITKLYKNYRNLFNQEKIGFISIEKGVIHLLNGHAKDILEINDDYLSFEEFQTMLTEQVFIDDFLYTNRITLKIKKDLIYKEIECKITKEDYVIYATITEKHYEELVQDTNKFINLPSLYDLLKEANHFGSKNIILFDIRNFNEFFRDYNSDIYKERLELFIGDLKNTCKNHLDKIYLESFNLIYVTLKTIDKRVVKRIIDVIYKEEYGFDIRSSIIQVNQGLNFNGILKLRYLNSLTKTDAKVIYDNKNFRYNQELAKTLLININNMLSSKTIPLEYQGVGDWQDNTIKLFKVNVSSKAMLGEVNTLKRVLKIANLENEWDSLIITELVNQLKKDKFKGRFILDVSCKTFENVKALKRCIKKLSNVYDNLDRFYFMIDLADIENNDLFIESLKIARENGIKVIGYNFYTKVNLHDFDLFRNIDGLILSSKDIKNHEISVFLGLLESYNLIYILNHENDTLLRSELEENKVQLVYGSKFPKYESVTAIN